MKVCINIMLMYACLLVSACVCMFMPSLSLGVTSDRQMQAAKGVVERFQARGGVLPRQWKDRACPDKLQEYK